MFSIIASRRLQLPFFKSILSLGAAPYVRRCIHVLQLPFEGHSDKVEKRLYQQAPWPLYYFHVGL
jgi:hypothetical protein